MIYNYTQARQSLAQILEQAQKEGQVKLRSKDGQVFVIKPELARGKSPLDVPAPKADISKEDILRAIADSRERR